MGRPVCRPFLIAKAVCSALFIRLSIFFTSQPFHITHPRNARAAVAHPLAQTSAKGCKAPFWRREASSVAGRWNNDTIFYPSTALANRYSLVGFLPLMKCLQKIRRFFFYFSNLQSLPYKGCCSESSSGQRESGQR